MLHGRLSKNYYIKVNKSAYHICPYKRYNPAKIISDKQEAKILI